MQSAPSQQNTSNVGLLMYFILISHHQFINLCSYLPRGMRKQNFASYFYKLTTFRFIHFVFFSSPTIKVSADLFILIFRSQIGSVWWSYKPSVRAHKLYFAWHQKPCLKCLRFDNDLHVAEIPNYPEINWKMCAVRARYSGRL